MAEHIMLTGQNEEVEVRIYTISGCRADRQRTDYPSKYTT